MKNASISTMIEKMEHSGLIPVFFHRDIEVCKEVLRATYNAGIRVFEFTNRGNNALEVFKELVIFSKSLEGCIVGIGTIFYKEDAEKFHKAGAAFIVSPALVPEVGKYAAENNLLWIPGCGTVTEAHFARVAGATLIKVFPGNVLGANFVKSIKAVMPDVKIMPTGGVTVSEDNLHMWFKAGVSCVGMGSQLVTMDILKTHDYERLTQKTKGALSIIEEARNYKG
ncbi:MAG: bifunctional 4-hydroxy-2-oxoglutarate aldolase/2-dehydro-3-deoxy-phosphogluconate aldolase [Eudoraea sp.]